MPKISRVNPEPIEKQLEKIAKNTAHPEESKLNRNLRSFEHMKQRQMVELFRQPQNINAHVISNEYGNLNLI